ncbi:hypothetical protein Ccrd_024231 [Cynara cardunculus var. scolymus]|uniref:Uncharacterized protein n=1 Tax=Cynara cardunculus var. scolymus TaxID=59895 RepID=A0A118JSD0_CYNCS|nr:hypothetical protein Ccrd_024231 [Cynara cardunculus var. scolymus]
MEDIRTGTGDRQVVFGKYEIGRLFGPKNVKVYHTRDLVMAEGVVVIVIKTEQVKKEGLMVKSPG